MSIKKIYFVRHGETTANLGGYYQSPDVQLSEKGHLGAQALAERFAHIEVEVVISSTFVRALQTATCITKQIGKPLITSEHIHEVINNKNLWGKHFESEEGKAYEEERSTKFVDPTWHPEGAENYFDVSNRVNTCIKMLEESEYSHIVLVSHGNFLRLVIARLLLEKQDDPSMNLAVSRTLNRMSNVAITEFIYEEGKWQLFTWNDHAHFAE